MNLRFILGRAGTGKTETCIRSVASSLVRQPAGGPALILLVPEQATFQMEKRLVGHRDLRGLMRAQVLSFRRLAWRVLSETGGSARVRMDENGRQMILRSLIEAGRDRLRAFHLSARQTGFIQRLSRTLTELRAHRIGRTHLDRWLKANADTASASLLNKMTDLSLMLEGLEQEGEGRPLDPDEHLDLLADRVGQSSFLRGCHVWIDGFSGFTPQELAVLGQIMRVAATMQVALCLDPDAEGNGGAGDLFQPTWETYTQLLDLAREAGARVETPLKLRERHRFSGWPALDHLESTFGAPVPPPWDGGAGRIRLMAAPSRRDEVEWTAREMVRLVRDRGYRWRDLSLIVRHLDPYQSLISTVFEDYDIPYFTDQKRPLGHHPLLELLRSCLSASQSWAPDPLFRVLRTDLFPLDRATVDRLENYVLAHGIRGQRWIDETRWEYWRRYSLVEEDPRVPQADQELLKDINAARDQVVDHLGPLSAFVRQEHEPTVADMCRQMYLLLDRLDVGSTLTRWEQRAEEGGRLEEADEHRQVWNLVMNLLDQAVATMGRVRMSPERFTRVLESGLESLRLGLIPPSLDQVLVAAIDRSRHPDVKTAFVLGLNEGVFPDLCPEDVIFTDFEREELIETGLDIAPPSYVSALREQFLAYIAFTRSTERLYLSYVRGDGGGSQVPSLLISHLRRVFPDLEEEEIRTGPQGDCQDLHFLTASRATVGWLARYLRRRREGGAEASPLWQEVHRQLVSHPQLGALARKVLASLSYENRARSLPSGLVEVLLGKDLETSVTRLESYGRCPFSHYAGAVLGLRERQLHQLDAPRMGVFFHAALHLFMRRLTQAGETLESLSESRAQQVMRQVVDYLAPRLEAEILMSSSRHRHITRKLTRRLLRAAGMLRQHATRGQFRPVGAEVGFGPGEPMPPLEIPLDQGSTLRLRGQIDLVDATERGGEKYVRVIDYKSGRAGLEPDRVVEGLDLQLATYMMVVLQHSDNWLGGEAVPAGLFHFPVIDPLVRLELSVPKGSLERDLIKQLSLKGLAISDPEILSLMADDPGELVGVTMTQKGLPRKDAPAVSRQDLELLLSHVGRTLAGMGKAIRSGTSTIAPYRRDTERACSRCSFHPVCQFDVLVEGNTYRDLPKRRRGQVWEQLREGAGSGE